MMGGRHRRREQLVAGLVAQISGSLDQTFATGA